jgi:hypothetical protein
MTSVIDLASYRLIDFNIASGNPVIVRVRLPGGVTHFVVIAGKDGFDYLVAIPAPALRKVSTHCASLAATSRRCDFTSRSRMRICEMRISDTGNRRALNINRGEDRAVLLNFLCGLFDRFDHELIRAADEDLFRYWVQKERQTDVGCNEPYP